MKHFWLIRHAKSSWAQADQADFDRPLNERGRRNGSAMAAWLGEQTEVADWLVTSAAKRAQQTAAYVGGAFQLGTERIAVEKNLYHASPDLLLDALQSAPADCGTIALVAHNPGLTYLVSDLLAPKPAMANLPTMGCALFRSQAADWFDVAPHNCELQLFMAPKLLAS